MVRDLEGSLGGAVPKELLLDPRAVEIAQELVAAVLQFLELAVGHSLSNVRHDLGIEIAEAYLAAVDHGWKVIQEELLPNLLVDPFDLQEVARHQFVEAVLRRDLEELLLHSEVSLLRRHLFDRLAVFVLLDELEGVVGLDLDDVDQPVKGIGVAIHRDLDSLGLLHLGDHLREVWDRASVFLEPLSLEEDLLERLLLLL